MRLAANVRDLTDDELIDAARRLGVELHWQRRVLAYASDQLDGLFDLNPVLPVVRAVVQPITADVLRGTPAELQLRVARAVVARDLRRSVHA